MHWTRKIVAVLLEGPVLLSIRCFIGLFAQTMEQKGFDDPVYKKNLERLIKRYRQFEDTKE